MRLERRGFLGALCMILTGSLSFAETLTVCPSGCDYSSVNDAIAMANDGDTIQLSAEVYREGSVIDFQGKSLTLRGELDRDGNPASLLDGQEKHGVLSIVGVEFAAIENLVVANGSSDRGGGLQSSHSSIQLTNVHFVSCRAATYGGGIDLSRSQCSVYSCKFEFNTSSQGGAISRSGSTNEFGYAFLRCYDSDFSGNRSQVDGGAVRCALNMQSTVVEDPLVLERCRFTHNESGRGGAVYIDFLNGIDGYRSRITDATFEQNMAESGGAIAAYGLSYDHPDCLVERSRFAQNTASENGGAIWIRGHGIEIQGGQFSENYSGDGSVVFNEEGVGQMMDDFVMSRGLAVEGAVFCGAQGFFIRGYWVDLGGNVFAASCEDLDASGIPDSWEGVDLDRNGVLEVPGEFGSVLAAVASAAPGDVVHLARGVHQLHSPISAPGVSIGIRGEVDSAGRPVSILDAYGQCRIGQVIGEDSSVIFEDLVLQNGQAPWAPGSSTGNHSGGLVFVGGGRLELRNCRLICGDAEWGGAVASYFGDIEIESCLVSESRGSAPLMIGGSNLRMSGCEVSGNLEQCCFGALYINMFVDYGREVSIDYCSFFGNGTTGCGGGGCGAAVGVFNPSAFPLRIGNCVVSENDCPVGLKVWGRGVELSGTRLCGNAGVELEGEIVDLGGNIIADTCENDCNFNGVIDLIDIVSGYSTDCDGNSEPDECQFLERRGLSVSSLPGPLGDPLEFEVSDLGFAIGDVVLELSATGDLGQPSEFLVVSLDGEQVGLVFLANGESCIPVSGEVFIPANIWNATGKDGTRVIQVASVNVDSGACEAEYLSMQVTVPVLFTDCDGNGLWDICDINEGGAPDLDGNGLPDSCDSDCDGDGEPDAYEIATGQSEDCNLTGVPDECEIEAGDAADVDGDGVPDPCQDDCDSDGLPDSWEIAIGTALDCNRNQIPDDCDIYSGSSADVDSNGIPDECKDDCNGNGTPDYWEILTGAAEDCDGNGTPDQCDIASGTQSDCDVDGLPDACALADGMVPDCNENGVPDQCDLGTGGVEDDNGNGIPDVCELALGDLDLNGCIDAGDLGLLFVVWGLSSPPFGDLDGDGVVGASDLGSLLTAWNPCP